MDSMASRYSLSSFTREEAVGAFTTGIKAFYYLFIYLFGGTWNQTWDLACARQMLAPLSCIPCSKAVVKLDLQETNKTKQSCRVVWGVTRY